MRLRLPIWQCAAALIGALVLTAPADAAQYGQKLDDALRNAKRGGEQRVIIRSRPGRFAELRQALRSYGGLKISDKVTTLSILGGK